MKFHTPIFLAALCCAAFVSCMQVTTYMQITGYAQGGTYKVTLKVEGNELEAGRRTEMLKRGIDSVLTILDNSLSGYNEKSLLSRFNSGLPVIPDSIFVDIYDISSDIYRKTGGMVDVASAPLYDIWGFGFKSEQFPDSVKVGEIRSGCGMHRLKENMRDAIGEDGMLYPENLLRDGVSGALPELNYNAIAQGYSCDLVVDYLSEHGIYDMLVDIGGEIFCQGKNPSGKAWTIGIDRPEDGNMEPGADLKTVFRSVRESCGIVTSGNYRKYYVRNGKKYSHTINPETGYPVDHSLLSATIIAGNATIADAYATYCMVVGLDAAKEFIESNPDLDACLIYDENGRMESWMSSGFPSDADY